MTTERSPSPTHQESASTGSTRHQILESLRSSKEYRHAFIEEAIRSRITAQIKSMREQQPWDYKQFSDAIRKNVSWAYRLEDPNAALPTIPTLLQVAEALDVALDVRFVSFSNLLNDLSTMSAESFQVPTFDEDAGLIERKDVGMATETIVFDTRMTGTGDTVDLTASKSLLGTIQGRQDENSTKVLMIRSGRAQEHIYGR